ncbi:MAG TPA: hypothetical protein DCK95_08070 [Anaerolineaceae bacterium]|nr:hypothetical protein [Anaerolineaceae bacterium]
MSKLNFLQAVLLFLLVLAIGVGSGYLIIYYLIPSSQISELLVRIMILLVVGIMVGLVIRFALAARLVFLKILYGILGSLLSIAILDYFFPGTYSLIDKEVLFHNPTVSEYAQMGSLLALTLFTGLGGRKKKAPTVKPPRKPPITLADRYHVMVAPITNTFDKWQTSLSSIHLNPIKKSSPVVKKRSPQPKSSQARITTAQPIVKVKAKKETVSVKKKPPVRKVHKKDENVKLVGTEDHRCPYCLEEVHKNDPRGIVICPDCGTWHHRDCWEITGSCQIAHKHEL